MELIAHEKSIRTKRALGRMVMIGLGVAGLAGCASSSVSPRATAAASGGGASGARVADVGSVVVSYAISGENRELLERLNGAARLKTTIEGKLAEAAKLKSGSPRVLQVEVTDIRLRSAATMVWAGVMAGVDTLQVQVTVRDAGQVVHQFTTGASTSGVGVVGNFPMDSRYQTMADAVAERIAKDL
jgi:hypothetical protein